MSTLYKIKWGNDYAGSQIFGSTIQFLPEGNISYACPLLSSGETIKEWTMVMPYIELRRSPSLPLLKNGKSYDIELFADLQPQGSVQILVEFFDENADKLESIYINEQKGTFDYPESAYSYTIKLVNKTNSSFIFEYLLLSESETTENYDVFVAEKRHFVEIISKAETKGKSAKLIVQRKNCFMQSFEAQEDYDISFYYLAEERSHHLDKDVKALARLIQREGIQELTICRGRLFRVLSKEAKSLPQMLENELPDVNVSYEER